MDSDEPPPMTEAELLHIFRRSKQYPTGRYRVTIIDKDYQPAGMRDLQDPNHKAFSQAINDFLKGHELISIDDVPEDFLLRSLLLGLKSQSTSLRSKSIDYLMQLKGIGKYQPPPEPEEEEWEEEADPVDEETKKILDQLSGGL